MVSKRRVLVALLFVLVAWAALRPPVTRADSFGGTNTTGCVKEHTIWAGSMAGYQRIEVRYRLEIEGSGGVIGKWLADGQQRTGGVYSGPGVFFISPSTDHGDGYDSHAAVRQPAGGSYSYAAYRVALAHEYADVCIRVTDAHIVRYPAVGNDPEPTPAPSATPYATATAPLDSPPPGHCWVQTGGGVWTAYPCSTGAPTPTPTAPPPTSSPSPGGPGEDCGDSTLPIRYAGTYQVSATTGANGWCLLVDLAERPAYITVTVTLTVNGLNPGGCPNVSGSYCQHNVLAYRYPVTAQGSRIGAPWYHTNAEQRTDEAQASGDSYRLEFCTAKTVWPHGLGSWNNTNPACGLYGGHHQGQYSDISFSGTITVSGAATPPPATPTPTPGESPDCGIGCNVTPPPDWETAPPTQAPGDPSSGGGGGGFDICDPAYSASGRSVCATWPPTPGPGATPEPWPSGGVAGPSPGGDMSQLGLAFDELGDQLAGRAPFSWAAEVAGALSPTAYAGAPINWCFTALDATICVDPYAVSDPIASYRPVFAGLLAVLLAWAIARRVWAVLGGTPAAGDA